MRYIYFSPHMDDAIISAGGLIFEQAHAGHIVEIWTILSGFPTDSELSPLAQALHSQWGTSSADETVRLRRMEDVRAAEILGAKTQHFDFMDCIYRRAKNGDWCYSDVFVQLHADETDLPAQITEAVSFQLRRDTAIPQPGSNSLDQGVSPLIPGFELVCPLGVGSHVDHLLVRGAVEALSRPLLYYTDIPYLFNHPTQLTSQTVGMKDGIFAVSEAGLEAWLGAAEAYRSQLGMVFENAGQMQASLRSYREQTGGIRLWAVE
jgi:LmbE family N-acetylglucosaminyl deacetylase